MQGGWSDTGTGSWRGCAIAIVEKTQNLTGEGPQMQMYPCFERHMRPECSVRALVASPEVAEGLPAETFPGEDLPPRQCPSRREAARRCMRTYTRHRVFVQFAEHTQSSWAEPGEETLLCCFLSLTAVIVNTSLEDYFQKRLKTKVALPGSRPEVLSTPVTSKTQM